MTRVPGKRSGCMDLNCLKPICLQDVLFTYKDATELAFSGKTDCSYPAMMAYG